MTLGGFCDTGAEQQIKHSEWASEIKKKNKA